MPEIKLNHKQTIAFNLLQKGENIFITGPGGVGKSALIKIFKDKCSSKTRNIVVTSTSALILNGTTMHSYLGIRTGTGSIESMVVDIQKKPHVSKKWRTINCLIIDEISMLDPDLFDKIEHMARIIRKNSKPFGGIQLVVSGDFLQLPCVGTNKFCFQAESWSYCLPNTVYLTEIVRQRETDFQKCLNNIRMGLLTSDVRDLITSRVGVSCINKYDIIPTKLYSSNYEVDHINNVELDKLSGDDRQFYSYDMNIITSLPKYMIEKTKKNCNAQEELELCVGCQVMLLKNIDIENGLVNGSRGIITEFVCDIPKVMFLNGIETIIDIATWDIMDGNTTIMTIEQIPLKVAYAISIHKSQGCSLDCVEIDLGSIFECGQAYVALSRVKSLKGLSILKVNFDKIRAHPIAVEYYNSLLEEETVVEVGEELTMIINIKEKSTTVEKKLPSHMISCQMFKQGLSIDVIADKRNCIKKTILSHLCKGVSEGVDIDLSSFVTDQVRSRVIKAYNQCDKPKKMKPIFEFLDGFVSYDEIRISMVLDREIFFE